MHYTVDSWLKKINKSVEYPIPILIIIWCWHDNNMMLTCTSSIFGFYSSEVDSDALLIFFRHACDSITFTATISTLVCDFVFVLLSAVSFEPATCSFAPLAMFSYSFVESWLSERIIQKMEYVWILSCTWCRFLKPVAVKKECSCCLVSCGYLKAFCGDH